MHPVFVQAFAYGILSIIMIAFTGLFLKGFFWKYVKVRMSFGKYLMVKIRGTLRDHFAVGKEEEGFLVYKINKDTKRVKLTGKKSAVYRCLAVSWIDTDEENNAISSTDYTAVSGFDAIKYSNLYIRALVRPQIMPNQEKIIVALLLGVGIIGIATLYFGYVNAETMTTLVPQIQESIKASLVGAKGTVSTVPYPLRVI